jgi:hypothetical protein
VNSPNIILRTPIVSIKTGVLTLPLVGTIFGIAADGIVMAYYKVLFWEWVHLGFPNQYTYFQLQQCTDAGSTPDNRR